MSSPLTGIRVVDLSRVLAGPQATAMLGDLGAEIIKVESPHGGDETRSWLPEVHGMSAAFLSVNRNKRSIAIDLTTEHGQRVVTDLIETSDVLVENFRAGTMERWGLTYEDLRVHSPRLIYVTISAFGRAGGLAERPGYEAVLQAFSGVMSITGEADGEPVRSGPSLLDLGTGMLTAHAVTAAILDREQTGRGQRIDTSLLGTAMTFLGYHAQGFLATGETPQRMGSGHTALVPYRAYPCRDDEPVFVSAGNDGLFARFCDALDLAHLTTDPRFVDLAHRRRNRTDLDELIAQELAGRSRASVLEALDAAGVPASPVNDVSEVISHPQVQELKAIQTVHHPTLEQDLDVLASPIRASEMTTDIRLAPPILGEHTDEILGEIGYGSDDRAALRREGVIA